MRRNLRLSAVGSVILDFKTYNAPAHKFNNSAISANPVVHPRTKFQQNFTIRGWVIDDLTNFPGPVFRERDAVWPILSVGCTELQ